MSTPPLTTEIRLSDEEYMRRLRDRFVRVGGAGADEVADAVSIAEWRRDEFENDPEGAADEEMSYWGNDGDE